MCLESSHAKFERSRARGTFSNLGLNRKGYENVLFSTENWPYLGNGER